MEKVPRKKKKQSVVFFFKLFFAEYFQRFDVNWFTEFWTIANYKVMRAKSVLAHKHIKLARRTTAEAETFWTRFFCIFEFSSLLLEHENHISNSGKIGEEIILAQAHSGLYHNYIPKSKSHMGETHFDLTKKSVMLKPFVLSLNEMYWARREHCSVLCPKFENALSIFRVR